MGAETARLMPQDQVSTHFTLAELTRTDTGLANVPNAEQLEALVNLAEAVLEPYRALVGPIRINSGFRSLAVNTKIGGAHNSQHMLGQAADTMPVNMSLDVAFQTVKRSEIPYDQLIIEPTWIHISAAAPGAKPRRQCLRAHREGGRMVYECA